MPNRRTIPSVPIRQVEPRAEHLASTAPLKKFGLAWESYATVPGEITGIESSTNLVTWKLEAEWPIQTESNTWTDFAPSPDRKFYRAFNRAP